MIVRKYLQTAVLVGLAVLVGVDLVWADNPCSYITVRGESYEIKEGAEPDPAWWPEIPWHDFTLEADGGEQGFKVLLCDCGSIIPAHIGFSASYDWTVYDSVHENCEAAVSAWNAYDIFAEYDPEIFSVYWGETKLNPNGSNAQDLGLYPYFNEDHSYGSGAGAGLTVNLVSDECAVLARARQSKVLIYGQSQRHAGRTPGGYPGLWAGGGTYEPDSCTNWAFCDEYAPGTIGKADFYGPVLLATVEVVQGSKDFACRTPDGGWGTLPGGPINGGPAPGTGGNGPGTCKIDPAAMRMPGSGGCGSGDGLLGVQVGHAQGGIGRGGNGSGSAAAAGQGHYASVNGFEEVEANFEDFWFRVNQRPGWGASSVTYDEDGDDITRISFYITDPTSATHYYHYGDPDLGTTEALARLAARGKQRLQYAIDAGAITRRLFEYNSSGNNATRQLGLDSGGLTTGYVLYEYDDAGSTAARLRRMWAGADPADFATRGSTPDSGRWIDTDYDEHGMITHISHGCGSCGVGERNYTYLAATLNQSYDTTGGTFVPTEYLTETVKASDNSTVLASFQYDSSDRLTAQYLGASGGGGLKVTDWSYDPDGAPWVDHNVLIRREYVDNTNYRASVYIAGDDESLEEERHYHALQSGTTLVGKYSAITYTYEEDASGKVTRTTTTLPEGSLIYQVHDVNKGKITQEIRTDGAAEDPCTINVGQYTYVNAYGYSNPAKYVISESIDTRGATANYQYDTSTGLLTRQIAGDPDNGDFAAGRVTTYYDYDGQNRLTRQRRGGADGWVTTFYAYDEYDNMVTQIDGYDSAEAGTTCYYYNAYNELTKTVDPEGAIRKMFYSSSGSVTAEAVIAQEDVYNGHDLAFSETAYVYDEDGYLITKRLADASGAFTRVSPGPTSWIDEAYKYDSYGRRTAVIADVGGANLTTAYEYNNQSEVVKVIYPDTRYKETIRDGRGLAWKEVAGIGATGKATTVYTYDLNGNLIYKTDPEGVKDLYQYDAFDRMIRQRRGI